MTNVAPPTTSRPNRSTPVALLYVGMPAYLIVISFSVRDLLDSHTVPVAAAAIAAVVIFTACFFWQALVFDPRGDRLRFACDLHDLLGPSLTVIRAKSELASRLAPTDIDKAVSEMNDVERVAREALAEVRETVTGYRRPSLAAELANARTALDAANITADVHADVIDAPAEIDTTLAWVLRE